MNRRSSTEWEAIVRKFQQSGMTQKAFCESNDLKLATLGYWVRKINRLDRGEEGLSIVELAMPVAAFMGSQFLSTTIQTEGITIPVENGNGTLRITGSISIEQLGRIIQACNSGEPVYV